MDVNNRKAPKRAVVQITKTGNWGNYEYEHLLECGHTEIRKRAAGTDVIACAWCVRAAVRAEEIAGLQAPQRDPIAPEDIVLLEEDQRVEEDAARVRAGLAASLQIPSEAIDVVTSVDLDDPRATLRISHVVIFMTGEDAIRISGMT